ncbi:tetratricopeptide repeat protein [Niastella populi]|nr:tetratricopeptide repeat protein [Niastella populi]
MNSQKNTIVFTDSSGNILTTTDLANVTGNVNYQVKSEQYVDSKAQSLQNEARSLGQSGKYDLAINKLKQAIQIQPNWAYPIYDLAFTYLLKGDYGNALKYYKQTDSVSPKGFFTAKTAIYALEGEQAGEFPNGLYLSYLQIEWTDDLNKKLAIAKAITEKFPGFAPAWKELAVLSDNKQEKNTAIERGLSLEPDNETKGILLINRALVLNENGKKEEAIQVLGNYIFSPDATMGNIELAKFTLKSIAK